MAATDQPSQQLMLERILRKSERLFRTIFEHAPMPWVIANPDGELLEANPHALEVLGYAKSAVGEHSLRDLALPEDWAEVSTLLNDVIDGRKSSFQQDRRLPQRDGEILWVRITTFGIPGEDGTIQMVVQMWEDISASRQAAIKLQEQAALLDLIPAAVVELDSQDTIVYWSAGAERLYGWSRDEAIGRRANIMTKAEPAEIVDERRRSLLERGEWEGCLDQVDQSGADRIVESRWRVFQPPGSEALSLLVINMDVTERKRLETQLTAAQRMESVGQLAAGIAHDFNNILAPIMMSASVLVDESGDAQTREMAKTIEKAGRRGAAVVRQLLSFARMDDRQRATVPVKHVIDASVRLLKEAFPRTITIASDVAEGLEPVGGDHDQLSRVLMSLCINARNAMPTGGTLTLTARNVIIDDLYCAMHPQLKAGHFVSIKVNDTGVGIPPDDLARILEPRPAGGSPGKLGGLGLAVAHEIVRDQGGALIVSSELNRGTTVELLLPVIEEEDNVRSSPEDSARLRGNGETILVVDDEEPIRTLVSQVLVTAGYQVIKAANGIEAVTEFARHPDTIQVVLMDLDMPRMDGRTAVHILREMDPNARIVIATGSLGLGKLAENEQLEAFPRLCKPFRREQLLSLLRELLTAPPAPGAPTA